MQHIPTRPRIAISHRAGLLLAAVLVVLPPQPAFAGGVTLNDASGRAVSITDASRIVSVGGDVTEIIYALGLAGRIVAVDTTSNFPPQALKEKPNVGYMRALSSEGVLSAAPTVIFASERSGPPEVVKTLKSASVTYFEVPDRFSPDGVTAKIRLLGKALEAEPRAEELARKVEDDFKALGEGRARIKRPARVLFVLSVQNGRVVAGGSNTSADAILKLAGAENVAGSFEGYRPLTDEAIIELAPEAILAMRRSSDTDNHDVGQILAVKGIEASPAGAAKKLIMMEGLYLLGFGPRAPAAARELMGRFYPELAGAAAGK